LYLIERERGKEQADGAALYMEYDGRPGMADAPNVIAVQAKH